MSLSGLLRLRLGPDQHLSQVHFQHRRNPKQRVQGRVSKTTIQQADGRLVQAGPLGELRTRNAQVLAPLLQNLSNFGNSIINQASDAGVGFRFIVASGNESDLTAADIIQAFVDDPETGRENLRGFAAFRTIDETALIDELMSSF